MALPVTHSIKALNECYLSCHKKTVLGDAKNSQQMPAEITKKARSNAG
jgi:hypothetical protein